MILTLVNYVNYNWGFPVLEEIINIFFVILKESCTETDYRIWKLKISNIFFLCHIFLAIYWKIQENFIINLASGDLGHIGAGLKVFNMFYWLSGHLSKIISWAPSSWGDFRQINTEWKDFSKIVSWAERLCKSLFCCGCKILILFLRRINSRKFLL